MATKTISVTIPGLDRLARGMKLFPNIVKPKLKKAMGVSIKDIQKATVPITPLDTGRLRNTLKEQQSVTATRGEIGSDLVYALRQHEETSWNHPRGGEAKYLEKGLKKAEPKILRNFGRSLDETLKIISKFSK